MSSTRREFLQRSAAASAAIALGPLTPVGLNAGAETLFAADARRAEDPKVKAFEDRMLRARPVALNRVRVTGGPLATAQMVTARYLLSLDPDRMMAFYRVRAGLAQKAAPYEGWDGGGRNLTGHIAGHHLSAVSLMYLATDDERFKTRADYLVREMKEVQDRNGDGYLGALAGGREAFAALSKGDIRSGGFDLNGLWSPWYTLHKTFAGLRDAYRNTGNETALEVERRYAAWAEAVLAPLNDAQIQKMLNTEHGGMNEVLADLYADTGDKRWLDLSYRFEHRAFTDPLKRHQDNLSGKHGNCQIPKLIGSAARYGYTGDAADLLAASFFWDRVAQHHSYASGGHGLEEYFGPPDRLSARVDGRTCETCNVYNMLKLTRRLFSMRPDPFYADFHERVLFNQILASIDPEDGRTSYMVPVGRGVQQEYQDMQQDFTCCVGTGMESHALHGLGIYYESADTVWVNLFVPSSARLNLASATLDMKTGFPDGDSATLTLTMPAPASFTMAVRRPAWAGDGFTITVNGEKIEQPALATLHDPGAGGRSGAPGNEAVATASTYVELKRMWRSGDVIELALPKSVRLEPTPDDNTVAAIMWGPLVLAGDHGPRREDPSGDNGTGGDAPAVPVLVPGERPLREWIVPSAPRVGDFRAERVARVLAQTGAPGDVLLAPFYRTHRRYYSVYFDVLTATEFDARVAAIAAERERMARMEAATLAYVRPGDTALERESGYRSEPVDRPVGRAKGRTYRAGSGWFSFDLDVDPEARLAVVVTYLNELGLPPAAGAFDVVVEGTPIATFAPNDTATGFYLAEYAVPAALVQGKSRATVRFQASSSKGRIAPVFGVRVIRAGGA